ncbi:amino acid lyase [Bifidobacterium dolichotidis]|uniref:Amino acid lyase n=1 Tax=Bifidobacterium dolichotidis TaxID=2306976 RepID=A0A430FPQ3_9BIFI|nr:aminotransferase class I/II-fold pyridoxal phosphate-dependent enzyme [Bifidobacterium dolichotidis]RSX54796.1 amino acid lyase [Bifidobacterium dolichotidis]
MLSFENDYSSAAAPQILDRLQHIAAEQHPGYGSDQYCQMATEKIRQACQNPEADVWFLTGGTQTNATVLDTITPAYAGIVCADSGHINVHEAGAVEATGHKVLTIPGKNGKLVAADVDDYCSQFEGDANHTHMVYPGSVYVSQSTEYGTVYSRDELAALAQVAHDHGMPLYVDGARLGYALESSECDMTLADMAMIADVFTIGGTKQGALFGEAVVFTKHNTPSHFLTLIKQHGALLAKGFLLGLQFDTLFTDNLYFRLAKHADDAAERIRTALLSKGYTLTFDSPTNQIMITVTNEQADALIKQVRLSFIERLDKDHVVLRICTSWATTDEQVDALIALL